MKPIKNLLGRFYSKSKQTDQISKKALSKEDFHFNKSGIFSTSFSSISQQSRAFELLPWVYTALQVKIEDTSQQRWFFVDDDGEEIKLDRIDKNITLPFSNGYQTKSFSDIIADIEGDLELTGQGLMIPLNLTMSGLYNSTQYDHFCVIQPEQYTIELTNDGNFIEYFKVNKRGVKSNYKVEDVVYFSKNTVRDGFHGTGAIKALSTILQGELESDLFFNYIMENRATPSLFFKMGFDLTQGAMTSSDFDRFETMFNAKHRGLKNSGKTLIAASKDADVKPLSLSNRDLQTLEMKEWHRDCVLSAFQVPPERVGVIDNSNRSTVQYTLNQYYKSINSLLSKIENSINHQFVRPINSSIHFKLERHNTSDIDDTIKKVNSGLITLNQASKRLNEEVVEDDDSRNTYYLPANLLPISFLNDPQIVGNISKPTENNPEKKNLETEENTHKGDFDFDVVNDYFNGKSDEEIKNFLQNAENADEIADLYQKASPPGRKFQAEYLRRNLKSRLIVERKYLKDIKKFFRGQSERVLSKLNKAKTPKGARYIFKIKEENEHIAKEIKGLHTSIIQRAIADIQSINTKKMMMNKEVSNPEIAEIITTLGYLVKRINETTLADLQKTIGIAIEDGWSIIELQEKIADDFVSFTKARSRMIARTETRFAYDKATKLSYEELEVKNVDVIGCTGLSNKFGGSEPEGYCGARNLEVKKMDQYDFHPNHLGCFVPVADPS